MKGGKGGNGSSSFARDNFTPRGKADGGNGGNGGNVVALSDPSINNLNHIRHEYKAENGTSGGGNGCYGITGKDIYFSVPIGTLIYRIESDGSKNLIDECAEENKHILLAKGGKGGRGNRALRTNNHEHEAGTPGDETLIELDMRTIADIGLVGQPNAGKSSFLACMSRSSPKIGPYPFTTLSPNIGMAILGNGNSVSIADVPGLIEGAHQNVGLGHEFLKHVQKNQNLILVLDISSSSPVIDANSVLKELELYQKGLSDKIVLILANKIDRLSEPKKIINQIELAFPQHKVLPFSAKYRIGLDNVKDFIEKIKC